MADAEKKWGWVGVDFDGTLAEDTGWKGDDHLGAPIPAMVKRVQKWLSMGYEVRIFTARVSPKAGRNVQANKQRLTLWSKKHIGQALESTCVKDMEMIRCFDDKAVQVIKNSGQLVK